MSSIILKEESYQLIGLCMEVHRNMGMGFREILYKDALELEFRQASIPYTREKRYTVKYKGITLPHNYYADFLVYNAIILEVKAATYIINNFVAQTTNYLKASGLKLGIIANFGEKSLTYKRIVF